MLVLNFKEKHNMAKEKKSTRSNRAVAAASKVTPTNAAIALNQRAALKPEVAAAYQKVVDGKSAAANDKPEPEVKAPVVVKAKAEPKARMTPAEVGAARKEGIRLFQLAGKPKPEDFVKVYGPTGPKLTWIQRAELGVSAEQFQKALKSGKNVTPAPKAGK
jgi:hypothetical protein